MSTIDIYGGARRGSSNNRNKMQLIEFIVAFAAHVALMSRRMTKQRAERQSHDVELVIIE